jgi:hypothetical protein
MVDTPEPDRVGLCVVVASFRSVELVTACVDALTGAIDRLDAPVDVFLARQGDGSDVEHLRVGRPWLTVLSASDAHSIPELRGIGMTAAGSRWIAVTEDHCLVDAGWLVAMMERTKSSDDVIGGGMGNARPGLVNWAAYFAEYGFFSASRPPGEGPPLITGANVMYGPDVSPKVAGWAAAGIWEDVVHQRLGSEGARFSFERSAVIRQNGSYALGSFCLDRYEHGRDYARVRMREEHVARPVRLLTIPLLPLVLWWRVRAAASGDDPRMFRAASPFILAFLTAWSVGEAAGYLRGPAPPSRDNP